MGAQEDWRARFLEAERRYEELVCQNDSTVHGLQQEVRMFLQDRESYKQELESMSTNFEQSELERFRVVEQLRDSYEQHLANERAQVEKERQRADEWIHDLKMSNQLEKRSYNERIRELEAEIARMSKATPTAAPKNRADEAVGGATGSATVCPTKTTTLVATHSLDGSGQGVPGPMSLHVEDSSHTANIRSTVAECGLCSAHSATSLGISRSVNQKCTSVPTTSLRASCSNRRCNTVS